MLFRSSQAPDSAAVVILEPALSTVAGVAGFARSSKSGQVALGEEAIGWVALGEGMGIIIVSGVTQSPFIGCCLKVVVDEGTNCTTPSLTCILNHADSF